MLITYRAAELQRQVWEETEDEPVATLPIRPANNHHSQSRAPNRSNDANDEVWQDYDERLWDSHLIPAPSLGSSPRSPMTSPRNATLERNGEASTSAGDSWIGWFGSLSPFAANSNTSQRLLVDGQMGHHRSLPNLSGESSARGRRFIPTEVKVPLHTKDCVVCVEEKSLIRFPAQGPTSQCEHEPNTCLDCLEIHIKTQLGSNAFRENLIKCPECSKALSAAEVQKYADPSTAELFMTRATDSTIDQIPNLFRCPAPNCESAQIHDSGDNSPIVRCVKCGGRFCFQHRVVWHETLSCTEYDRFLANPRGFRSTFELENEKVEQERAAEERRRRAQEERDAEYAQTLMADEQREEAKRRADAEKQARRERENRERKKREEEQKKQREQRRQMEEEANRKRRQEAANLRTIEATTKKCPNRSCGWPIEKNDGWYDSTLVCCKPKFANVLFTVPI